jgi:hypothetical protein
VCRCQVGVSPVSVDGMGVVLSTLETDKQGLPTKHLVANYTVFERSFRDSDEWRICQI